MFPRLLYYPADTSYSVAPSQLGAGAHTDCGMLTLLFQNGVGGLEIRDPTGVGRQQNLKRTQF